jgi:predicted aspartyl protease
MARYSYDRAYEPPIPEVILDITNPYTKISISGVSGIIDTGGDGITIPKKFVKRLNVISSRKIDVEDYDGKISKKDIYRITINIEGKVFENIEAIESDKDEIIIGRNILNQFKIVLDGKKEISEISDP